MVYYIAKRFFKTFIVRKPTETFEDYIVEGIDKEHYLNFMYKHLEWYLNQEPEDIYITSDDGLKLYASFLKFDRSKNYVICFHSSDGQGINDFSSMAQFYHQCGFNMILVDNRAHGKSEGKYKGFGVLERYDVKKWIDYAINRFGKNINIFLHGISVGGTTLLMASSLCLPQNVKAIIVEGAFTNPMDIFLFQFKKMYHFSGFPIIKMVSRIAKKYAGYYFDDVNTVDEVSKTNIPILFIHGDKDDLVPVWMAQKNYNACTSEKEILYVKGATHAKSYYTDTIGYERAIKNYMNKFTPAYQEV